MFMNKCQLAKMLGVSERTIDLWRSTEGLPSFQVGHVIRFEVEAVLAWVRARSAKSSAKEDSDANSKAV